MYAALNRILSIVLMTLVVTTPVMSQDQSDALRIEKARSYLQLLRDGKFDEFVANSDVTMKNALPADKLAEAWRNFEASFGVYEGEVAASCAPVGSHQSVVLVSKFAGSVLDVRITLNANNKIAGLFFTPSSQGMTYDPPDYANTDRFREELVTVNAGQFPLEGTLTLPKQDEPTSAVVLVHGSGPHDQDETIFVTKPFKDLAWGLATKGIAVLRYEKRTKKYGGSMDPMTITIDSETADDAVAAARMLMDRPDIRADRVYIAGHSLGASAAPYIASKEPRIAGLVMMAAAARPLHELVADQIPYLVNADGNITKEEQQMLDKTLAAVESLRFGKVNPSETLLGMPLQYWAGLDRMDPVGYALKYKRPIMILQGGRDYQVTDKDYAIWQDQLRSRENVVLHRYEKLDHLFHAGDGPSTPDQYRRKGHVDAAVVGDIAEWIKRHE